MPAQVPGPTFEGREFSLPIRVYWEDTDAGGVVYHAGYLRFMERARTEGLRALGIGQQALRDELDRIFVVRGMRIDFRAPARLDDLLEVRTRLVGLGHASLVFAQSVVHAADQHLLVQAEVRVACLAASGFRPRGLPLPLRERLQEFLQTPASEN